MRSIPACAGEPGARHQIFYRDTVYPRVCGGTVGCNVSHWRKQGLSPRVRGNPGTAIPIGGPVWSIPACAGEPCRLSCLRRLRKVYPRVCGGTSRYTSGSLR